MNEKSFKLVFGQGNAKLDKSISTFSLPSGWTCPGANECLCKANKVTGVLSDGKNMKFRCFSASNEAFYPNVRISRWYNFELLKKCKDVFDYVKLILDSLPVGAGIVRLHIAGDFFNQDYFDAWMLVAETKPNVIFYAYTKSLNLWVNRIKTIPKNLRLTASYGGKYDDLIKKHKLKYAKVVFSEAEAKKLKLEIDHNDSHAIENKKPFALLLHGYQPSGTPAAESLKKLKKLGIGSYNEKKKKKLVLA